VEKLAPAEVDNFVASFLQIPLVICIQNRSKRNIFAIIKGCTMAPLQNYLFTARYDLDPIQSRCHARILALTAATTSFSWLRYRIQINFFTTYIHI